MEIQKVRVDKISKGSGTPRYRGMGKTKGMRSEAISVEEQVMGIQTVSDVAQNVAGLWLTFVITTRI